ncbi:unnamed protein product [Blepharisma stoltei]|uniref:Uncharacterized protein n=1 Tax=Blepharisma stoltei TaxID=1481888 RepID=A0AAU9K682_9CILI|nr:unnamed protein product [Blepharisma stoltei]
MSYIFLKAVLVIKINIILLINNYIYSGYLSDMDKPFYIGSAIAATVGTAWILYRFSDDRTPNNNFLSQKDVISILRDLHEELNQVYIAIAAYSKNIQEKSNYLVNEGKIKEIVFQHTCIPKQIEKAESKVYKKYSTTEALFKNACKNIYNNNEEIANIMKGMQEIFENSFKGIMPGKFVPDFFNAEATLNLLEESYEVSIREICNQIESWRESGMQIEVIKNMYKNNKSEINRRIDEAKETIYRKFNIAKFHEPPEKIVQNAIKKYCFNDLRFKQRIEEMERNFKSEMATLI